MYALNYAKPSSCSREQQEKAKKEAVHQKLRSKRTSRELTDKEIALMEERETPLFPKPGRLGTFSAHGIEPGEDEDAPIAKINQDCGCVCYPFAEDPELALMVVMDGHGPQGEKVSQTLMHALVHALETSTTLQHGARRALEASFDAAHQACNGN